MYDDVNSLLNGSQYDGYQVVGYTIKSGQDIDSFGVTPSSETPGTWNDADHDGIYNGHSVSIGGLIYSTTAAADDSDEGGELFDDGDEWNQVQDPYDPDDAE